MKENEFLKIIKETLTNNSYIGNDCADLREVGMFITQDTLVEIPLLSQCHLRDRFFCRSLIQLK